MSGDGESTVVALPTRTKPAGKLPAVIAQPMSDSLRAAVETLHQGRYRIAAARKTGEGDFVMERPPTYHPDARARAQALKTARQELATVQTVREYFELLLRAGLKGAPTDTTEFKDQVSFSAQVSDGLPRCVWQEALIRPGRVLTFWPTVYEVDEIVRQVDTRQLDEIAALERLTTAPRWQDSVCGSTAYRDNSIAETKRNGRIKLAREMTLRMLDDGVPDLRQQLQLECARLRDDWAKAAGPEEAARFVAAFSEGVNTEFARHGLPGDFQVQPQGEPTHART